jgi:hypothetical protein
VSQIEPPRPGAVDSTTVRLVNSATPVLLFDEATSGQVLRKVFALPRWLRTGAAGGPVARKLAEERGNETKATETRIKAIFCMDEVQDEKSDLKNVAQWDGKN